MTVARRIVREATGRLANAGVPEAAASAEVLLAELLGVRRGELAVREEPLTDEQTERYEAWISRRLDREPVQRILGYAYFRNLKLDLNEHTLIPRPDTESVVDAALEAVDRRGTRSKRESNSVLFPTPHSLPLVVVASEAKDTVATTTKPTPRSEATLRVLDIGTGTGAIAIAIAQERPRCEVHATEISEEALGVARKNAELNHTTVQFHLSDVVSGLELPGTVDLLVSNPPYVASDQEERLAPEVRAWDPSVALFSGQDELLFYRRIFAETPPLLTDGADVVLEIGDRQADAVMELGRSSGFELLDVRPDLAGSPRAALLRWKR